jgi:hypothetical protein
VAPFDVTCPWPVVTSRWLKARWLGLGLTNPFHYRDVIVTACGHPCLHHKTLQTTISVRADIGPAMAREINRLKVRGLAMFALISWHLCHRRGHISQG